jgi:hypothetical protein
VWKQKGEEYRVTGGQGWCWRSNTRSFKLVPQDTVGLRCVARKLQARKRKNEKDANLASKENDSLVSLKTEVKDEIKTEIKEESDMEVDEVKKEIVIDSVVKTENVSEVTSETKSDIKLETGETDAAKEQETSDIKLETGETDAAKEQETSLSYSDLSRKEEDMCNTTEQIKIENHDNVKMENVDIENNSPVKKPDSDVEIGSPVKKMEVDVENDSPVKKMELDVFMSAPSKRPKVVAQSLEKLEINVVEESDEKKVISVGSKYHTVTINTAASKSLPPILKIDTLDISKALNERTYYDKITKPYAKLDMLLAKRIKQDEIETKQRQALQQQINWKLKIQSNPGTVKEEGDDNADENETGTESPDHDIVIHSDESSPYTCYSYLCRSEGKSMCYSPLCIHSRSLDEELTTGLEDSTNKTGEDEAEDEDVDIEGDKDDSRNEEDEDKDEKNESTEEKMDVDIESNNDKKNDVKLEVDVHEKSDLDVSKEEKKVTPSGSSNVKTKEGTKTEDAKKKTAMNSVPPILQNKKNAFFTSAQLALKQAIEKMSVDELRTKMPPMRCTKDKIKLIKYSRFGQKAQLNKKKASLPACHKFLSPSGKRTLFALEKYDLRKLARRSGKIETKAFNYNCKMTNVNWIYPCPRPVFKTAWKFRTQTVRTFGAVALQLRIMYVCLRWDDISIKSPVGGTNTVSTETEITTKELLKRRDVGPHMLKSEFLVRKIVVPLGITTQPKGKTCYVDCYIS